MSENLGAKIRRLRKEKGLTQRELAELAGINFTYLSKIENDNLPYSPSTKTLRKLAATLGASELELLHTAEKLPAEVQSIAHSEQGIRFLRRASKLKSPKEWEELFAFFEEREQGDEAQRANQRKPRKKKH